jgi:hypothetical protein
MSLSSRLRRMRLEQLSQVRIATPCTADWDAMYGDEKVRYCAQCRLNVYNLSAMDVEEAAEKLAENGDSVCLRLYRRADGKLLTKDCPVGVESRRAARRRVLLNTAGVLASAVVTAPIFFAPMGAVARPAAQLATARSAAMQGDLEMLRRMLDAGVPVDATGESGVTLLMTAALHGRLQIVRLLLARGADVNTRDRQDRTALSRAEDEDHPRVSAVLKRAGAVR